MWMPLRSKMRATLVGGLMIASSACAKNSAIGVGVGVGFEVDDGC